MSKKCSYIFFKTDSWTFEGGIFFLNLTVLLFASIFCIIYVLVRIQTRQIRIRNTGTDLDPQRFLIGTSRYRVPVRIQFESGSKTLVFCNILFYSPCCRIRPQWCRQCWSSPGSWRCSTRPSESFKRFLVVILEIIPVLDFSPKPLKSL